MAGNRPGTHTQRKQARPCVSETARHGEGAVLRRARTGAKPGCGDDGGANGVAGRHREREGGEPELALQDAGHLALPVLVAAEELHGAVAARADPLAAQNVGPQRRVGQHPVQNGRSELGRAGGARVGVKLPLCLRHEAAQLLDVPARHRRLCPPRDIPVGRPQQAHHALMHVVLGEGERLLQRGLGQGKGERRGVRVDRAAPLRW